MCDLIVVDDTAEMGLPETAVGLVPGGGRTQLLVRRAGPAVAADLILTARRVPAEEAQKLGLVDRVVGRGAARATAIGLARAAASNSPVAVRAAKRAMRLGAGVDLASALTSGTPPGGRPPLLPIAPKGSRLSSKSERQTGRRPTAAGQPPAGTPGGS